MNIKFYTARGLAMCTVTGILLGSALVLGYRNIEKEANQLGRDSIALQQANNLRTQLSSYMLSADLVLQSHVSHMLNPALRQSQQLLGVLDAIRGARLAADKHDDLRSVGEGVRRLQSLVNRAAAARGTDRLQTIAGYAERAEQLAVQLVQRVEDLRLQLERRARYNDQDLQAKLSLLQILSVLAGVTYLVIVLMTWLWSVNAIVRPIERLSAATERAQLRGEPFLVEAVGPDEVKQLTHNISAFVRTRAEFLATMSHELRTPLNGIINLNELMLETDLDEGQKEFARAAMNAGEALLALINDILDFSKIQAQRLELEQAPFDLRSVVDGAVGILSGLAEKKGIGLEAIVHHLVPRTVIGDSTRLRQVLMNLLNNALKFTPEGQVVVTVSTVEEAGTETTLMFCIKDTGIGIPEEARANLFQAFQQVDSSTTRKFGGTGLGLAICKELTALMGGSIGVESEVGAGSTFWFTIRIQSAPRDESLLLPAEVREHRMLIVSGRELVGDRLRQQLLALGMIAERVLLIDPDTDLAAVCDASDDPTWAIVDPYGCEDSAWDIVGRLRESNAPSRIAVLEHPYHSKPLGMGLSPVDTESLPEPTRMETIRAWLLGELVAVAPVETDVESAPAVQGAGDGPNTGGTDGAAQVLIAEDNEINQKVIQRILERAGYDTVVVENGQEAVDYLRDNACQLVLMDCQMPVMDGWEAAATIRELEALGQLHRGCPRPLPIIAVTANAMQGDRQKCLDVGMDDYLTKPLKPKKVIELIEEMTGAGVDDSRT